MAPEKSKNVKVTKDKVAHKVSVKTQTTNARSSHVGGVLKTEHAKKTKADKTNNTPETSKKRNFVLLDDDNKEIGRYTGNAPRQAALKVANTGVTSIRLRETGVRRKVKGNTEVKIHVFNGSRKQRKKTPSDPEWLPEKINYPSVEKVGVEWLAWSS